MNRFTSGPLEQHTDSTAQALRGQESSLSEEHHLIVLIDQRPLMRSSISQFIEARVGGVSVLSLSRPDQLKSSLPEHPGHIGLVVFSVGGRRESAQRLGDAVRLVRETVPDVPMVVVSDSDERNQVLQALRCGVQGFIPTSLSPKVVVAALQLVQAGGTYVPVSAIIDTTQELPPDNGKGRQGGAPWPELTPRQSEVLELLRLGKSNKVIAYELEMQESTVKVHIRHIMKKLKATNRTQAACIANSRVAHSGAADSGATDSRASSQAELVLELLPDQPRRSSH